jgi:ABC-2 type transport system ATP-binding protein
MATSIATSRLASQAVVTAHGLAKSFRRGLLGGRFQALKDIELEVRRGEVFGLLGPNGAGKTTLIKLLLGILHPTRGQAFVLGETAGSLAARRRIGYLPENLAFPRHHTGESALYFYGRLAGLSESTIRGRIEPLLSLVGLLGRQRDAVRKYSKGMRQRLGVAQALLHDPEILILDEPTDGLDPLGRSQMRDLIEKIRSDGKSVFLNSHILQEVELICDRVAIMAHGEIKAIGAIDELIDRHSQDNRIGLRLEVVGDESDCRSLFVGADVKSIEAMRRSEWNGESKERLRFSVNLSVESQLQVDHWIDRLRKADISLLEMERKRIRLEEIFLQLVAKLDTTPSHSSEATTAS